jgi:Fe-S-cluster-containing dehydrogenase component/CRP-like cAMP-binding protein
MSEASQTKDRPKRWSVPFSTEMDDFSVERVLSHVPFSAMQADNFSRAAPLRELVRNDMRVRSYRAGEIIVREGDYGTSAFFVMSGQAEVVLSPDLPTRVLGRRDAPSRGLWRSLAQLWGNAREDEVLRGRGEPGADAAEPRIILQDVPQILDRHRTATLRTGDFFGEIAALSRMPRTATIFARSEGTELLEIRWQGLRDIMRGDPALRTHINRIYRERALSTFLREIPFLRHLSPEAHAEVAAATQFETYGDYDWSGDYKKLAQSGEDIVTREPVVAAEGDYPNGVVLVRAGFARVTQRFGAGHRTLNYLGAGQIYGLAEIAHQWRKPGTPVSLQTTLRVIGYTHLLIIPTAVIQRVVLPSLPAEPEVEAAADTRTEAPASRLSADRMDFLTENRFFNGTKSMVIDMERCTRCDDCVRACASTHDNNPRFLRSGPIQGNIMVANARMHCADPVCMIGCPTGAIHRDSFEGEVVINPVTCIGCGVCANQCPYNSIRIVETRDADGEILVASDAKPILKATKCDLCLDQIGGPACVRACPHDALARVNLNTLDEFVDWLNR